MTPFISRLTLALAALLLAAVPAAAISQAAQVEKAAASGNLKRLERLLADDFDPGVLRDGLSPLHWAAWNGQVEAARLLIAHGVEVDVKSSGGLTPLMHAVQRSHDGTVAFLIEAGANESAENVHGQTPLHIAAAESGPEVVRLLVEAGADVHAVDDDWGNTPLHIAARFAAPEVARLMVEAGAEANAANIFNVTPLHFAAKYNDAEMVGFLLDAGADPLARIAVPDDVSDSAALDVVGFMPLDTARSDNPALLETDAGRRLQALTYQGTGCEGVIVQKGDVKLSILAERTLGRASRWKEITKLNGLDGKGYRKGDCLALP